MIPISRDQKLRHIIDGVTYLFIPPVGDKELELISAFKADDINLSPHYEKAVKELEAEYKGKRKPKKASWEGLIKDRIMSYLDDEEKVKKDIKSIDTIINMALVDWESKNPECPPFPKNGKPTDYMCFDLKSSLFEWYWDQFNLGKNELKK